jgi:osmoprotectant transport system substrate-binding protein
MTNRTRLRPLLALLILALAVSLAACGSSNKSSSSSSSSSSSGSGAAQPGKGKPAITLGSKNFTEQYVLGQLYTQALQAKGYTVNLKNNIGSSEITDKALTSGKIDGYPEYTGVIVQELAHENKRPTSADETYTRAKAFEAKRGYATLAKTPFFDADALAVQPAYAQKNGLKSSADLKKVKHFTYGGPPENKTRYQGVVGMQQAYGLNNFTFKPLTIGLQYQALDSGKIDVAAVFTTDGQLTNKTKYVVLTDPKGIFGFQNVTPVINKKKLAAMGPEFTTILNGVSSKLTNEAMQKMNSAVDLDKQKPADVAKQFLQANGLL